MDYPHRYRPIQGNNNICPICSISHFPFCPPINHHHHQTTPFHHHYPNNNNSMMYQPIIMNPINGQSWDNNMNIGYDNNSDRVSKKLCVDASSIGFNVGKSLSEDERRLNLIREHGGPGGIVGDDRASDVSKMGVNNYQEHRFSSPGQTQYNGYGNERLNNVDQYNVGRDYGLEYGQEVDMNMVRFRGFGSNQEGRFSSSEQVNGSTQYNGYVNEQSNKVVPNRERGPEEVFKSNVGRDYGLEYGQESTRSLFQPGGVENGYSSYEQMNNVSKIGVNGYQERGPEVYRGGNGQYDVGRDYGFKYAQESNRNLVQLGSSSNGHTGYEQYQRNDQYGGHVDHTRNVGHAIVSPVNNVSPGQGPHSRESYQRDNWRNSHQIFVPQHVPYHVGQDVIEQYHGQNLEQLQESGVNQENCGRKRSYSVDFHFPVSPRVVEQFDAYTVNKQGAQLSSLERQMFGDRPSAPPLPPTPRPIDPPPPPQLHTTIPYPSMSSSVYPVPVSSSTNLPLLRPSALERQPFAPRQPSPEKVKVIDASQLFRPPHRATRPDHIVVILRGLPGSGKSYIAKMLRDLEVEHGGSVPRIHSMDDYFMAEVEKVEELEGSKASASFKGKRKTTKKMMEYCYEPEMEEAYRSSMLKTFKKTLEEGAFTFIIVDDRNLRVADFAQFWANAKRSGYEVYLLEATYKDPVGCAARNIHGFKVDDIEKMAKSWEESPPLYLRLDIQPLLHPADNLKHTGIQEVDMEMDVEDGIGDECPSILPGADSLKPTSQSDSQFGPEESCTGKDKWDDEVQVLIGAKDLEKSKWLRDVDEEDNVINYSAQKNSNALSGLLLSYKGKSVHWGDKDGKTGFSIGAAKKANMLSLVIGPGSGYNLKTNPLPEEVSIASKESIEAKKPSVFQEQLRVERESYRVVSDRRRPRIGGLAFDDE